MIDKVQLRREIPRYIRTPQFRDNKDDNLISPAFETKFREKEEEYRKDKNKYSMYNTFLGVLDMADEKAQEISATLLDCTDEFWGEDTIRVGKYSPSLETLVLNIAATDFFAVKETKPKYSNLKYCINDWTSQMIRDNLFVYYFKDFWGQTASGKLVHIRPCIPAFDEKQARAILKKRLYQSTSVITEKGKVAYNEDNISKELDKNTFPFNEFGLDNALGLKYVKLPDLDKVEINSWRRFDGSNSTELVLFFNEIFCRSEKTLFFKDNTYSSIAENPLLNGGETYEASLPCHAFTPKWWVTFFNYCMSFLFAEELGLSIEKRLSSDSFNKLPEIQKITFDEYNKFHKEETEQLDKWAEDLKKEEERKEKERKAREEAEEKARKAAAEEKARKEAKMKILQPLINVRETDTAPTDMEEYTKSFFEYMKWSLEKRLENENAETWVFSPSSYNARYLFEHRNDEFFKNTFSIDKTPEEATDFCGLWASQYFFSKVKFPFFYEKEIGGKIYSILFDKKGLEAQLENKKQDADFVKSNHVTIDDFRFFMNWNYAVWKSDKYDNIENILSLKRIEHQEYFNTFFAIDKKRFSKKTLEKCGISENNEAELGKESVRVARERAFPCNPNENFLQNFYKATRRRKGLFIREYGKIYQYGVYNYEECYYGKKAFGLLDYSLVPDDLMRLTHAINCLSDYYLSILKAIEGVEGNFTPYNEMNYEEYKKISWIIVSENGRDIINDKYVNLYKTDKEAKQHAYETLKVMGEPSPYLLKYAFGEEVTPEEYYKRTLKGAETRMRELKIDHL